jgi:hypothetical protein
MVKITIQLEPAVAGPDGLLAINRALDDSEFQLDPAPGPGSAAVSAGPGRCAASRLSSSGRPRRERDYGGVVQRADDPAPAL